MTSSVFVYKRSRSHELRVFGCKQASECENKRIHFSLETIWVRLVVVVFFLVQTSHETPQIEAGLKLRKGAEPLRHICLAALHRVPV